MTDRIAFWFFRLASRVAAILPLTLLFRLGATIGSIVGLLGWPYRRLVLRNLAIAFGRELDAKQRRQIARKHFAYLGGNLLASLRFPAMRAEETRALVEIEGQEYVSGEQREVKGDVVLLSHIGNWELFAHVAPQIFRPPFGVIFQRLGNPLMDAEIRKMRAAAGVQLFERKEGLRGALEVLKAGGTVGVLIDQHAGDGGVWCPFFDRLASTSPMGAMLAARARSALLTAAMYTAGPGRWRLVIDPPLQESTRDTGVLTAIINQRVEQQIRRLPEDWFWVHNRWKTPKPNFLLGEYKRGVAFPPGYDAARLQPFKILIRSSNWLGDAVMSMPAVRAIKRGRPDAHVTILTPAKLADLWRTVAEVDEVLPIPPKAGVWKVAQTVARHGFDAALLFPNSVRTALEVWLAGIPRRAGLPGHRRAWLLNQIFREKPAKKKKRRPPRHQVFGYLRLAEWLGAETSEASLLPARDQRDPARRVRVAVCAGAEYGPAKRWPADRYGAAMRAISEKHAVEWVLVGVAGDRPIADAVLAAYGGEAVDLVGKTTLAELIEELRRCDLLLTNDTGTMHLAAHLGVPVVAIFGSTEDALTGPLGVGHTIIRRHVACSPCFLRECPLDFRCMLEITPEQVAEAVRYKLWPSSGAPVRNTAVAVVPLAADY